MLAQTISSPRVQLVRFTILLTLSPLAVQIQTPYYHLSGKSEQKASINEDSSLINSGQTYNIDDISTLRTNI